MKQGYKETNRKSFQEMKKRVPHCHPCLNVPSALTSGEKALWVQGKGTQESSSRRTSLCSAATQPHTPAQHSLASTQGYCGELQEHHTRASPLQVPPPPSSFHREAVKQLQFIMSRAVAGQTTHRKAWFAGTKLLSKLEAFPEKFTVQNKDPHNMATVTGTNRAKKGAQL